VFQVANDARFADVPPARIVPILADEGVYITSKPDIARCRPDGASSARQYATQDASANDIRGYGAARSLVL
jgi:putative transposase